MARNFKRMRRALQQLMDRRCDIQTRTNARDNSGGPSPTFADRHSAVPCAVQNASAGRQENYERNDIEVTHTVYFAADYSVTKGDRIQFDGRTFEVEGCGEAGGDVGVYWWADCREEK